MTAPIESPPAVEIQRGVRRGRSTLITGLDIGTTRTCAVIGEVEEEEGRLPIVRILGVGQARSPGQRGDAVTNIEEATECVRAALQEAELMAGVTVETVFAGVAGAHVATLTSLGVVAIEGDEVTREEVEQAHRVARAVALPADCELVHSIPVEYRVDEHTGVRDPVGMPGTRLETDVCLITCSAVKADMIRRAIGKAGYQVEELVLEPIACARSVLTEDEKEVGAAVIEIGASTTEVAAYFDGRLQHVAVLPLGGSTIDQDLVRGLNLPYAEARRAKERVGVAMAKLVDPHENVELPGPAPGQTRTIARELIAHVIEQRLDEILGLTRDQLETAGVLRGLGAGIVLTGGVAAMPGIVELAQQVYATPVRLGLPGEGSAGLAESVGRPRFACAVGLALYGLDRWTDTGRGATTSASGPFDRLTDWLREFF